MNCRIILVSFFFLLGTILFGQKEVLKIGVLPTTYGEGIPPAECTEFEHNILNAINNIPRYELVKRQKDFEGITLGSDLEEQRNILRQQGGAASVNFLLHISFGDTEWQSQNVDANSTFKSRNEAVAATAAAKRKAEAEAKQVAANKNQETTTNQKLAGKGNSEQLPGKQSKSSDSATLPGKSKTTAAANKETIKDTPEETTKDPVKKVWIHNAKMWVTINLYNVATGELENSIKVYAESFYDERYKKTNSNYQTNFQKAVGVAQAIILKKVNHEIKMLKPLDIELEKAIATGTGGRLYTVQIKDANFYGLTKGDALYVYKEKAYIINGENLNLEREVAKIEILEIKGNIAICEVRKGNDDLAEELKAGTSLKCNLSSILKHGYGF